MHRYILYIINPISGISSKSIVRELIREKMRQTNIPFQIIHSVANGDYSFLHSVIQQKNITDIVIAGGDGTVNSVINSLRNSSVRFGIIPLGSGNGLAYAVGIPRQPSKAIDVILKGSAKATDAFLINNRFSCMLSGLGFDAQVAHDFARKAKRGLITYTQQSIINYCKAHPYPFEIIIDKFSFYTEAFFISIANSNQFGNHVTIAPSASLQDGLLDVVIVQKMNKIKLPFAVLTQIRGNNKLQNLADIIIRKKVLYFQTPALKIRNLKLAPLHIDGEPTATETVFNIEIIKHCFQLIQPSQPQLMH